MSGKKIFWLIVLVLAIAVLIVLILNLTGNTDTGTGEIEKVPGEENIDTSEIDTATTESLIDDTFVNEEEEIDLGEVI